ncbi:hypothetical protein JCM19239_4460 [Vibrio variabilis]|uniref:DUF2797 domain-containing protein n=1 Tax=Vibrio variabilis TaxID=990271 RepID=A0ABQ0JPQ2_9VIBR|nr:hypothetical protein JCM19239_4460 [Vibrio variabilis]
MPLVANKIEEIRAKYGEDTVVVLDESITPLSYPVNTYPTKITSHNFDKQPLVTGLLQGIKGQYLILDTGVINIRKFTSYEVEVSAE